MKKMSSEMSKKEAMSEDEDIPPIWKKINAETYSTGDIIEHKDVNVKIEKKRWDVIITITDKTGNTIEYVATADGFWAEGYIWFGTKFAYEKIFELTS